MCVCGHRHTHLLLGGRARGRDNKPVIDDDGVCGSQIDPHTPRTCTKKKHETIGVFLAKFINSTLSEIASDATIQTFVLVMFQAEIGLKKVKHFHHLTENENFVPSFLQLWQQFFQE